jgi:U3 small nucleolar RNA-associated protein 20
MLLFCLISNGKYPSYPYTKLIIDMDFRFLTSSWKTKEADLCLSLLQLEEAGCITSQPSRPGYITCPNDWKLRIAQKLSEPGSSTEDVAVLSTYSKLHTAVSLSNETSILPQIVESLHSLLLSSFDSSISDLSPLDTFTCGQGFKTYVNLAFQCGSLDASLWRLITASGARFARSSLFLE